MNKILANKYLYRCHSCLPLK